MANQPAGFVPEGFEPDTVTGPHPEARISAASPGTAWPADEGVTLADIKADPVGSIQRIGATMKQEVTDPRLWLGLAASYFAPGVFAKAAPMLAKAAGGAKSLATGANVRDMATVIAGEGRVGSAIRLGGKVADAVRGPSTPSVGKPAIPAEVMARVDQLIAEGQAQGAARRAAVPVQPTPAPVQAPPALIPTPPPVLDMAGQPAIAARPPITAAKPSVMSPTRAGSELALAAGRQGVKLSSAEIDALVPRVVNEGLSPVDIVAAIKASLMSPAEALAAKLGTTSDADMLAAVAKRNDVGHWKQPRADSGAQWRNTPRMKGAK